MHASGGNVARRHRVQSKTPHPYDTPAEKSPLGRFYCGACNAEVLHRLQVFEPAVGQVTALHQVHSHRVCLACGTSKCSSATRCRHHQAASGEAA